MIALKQTGIFNLNHAVLLGTHIPKMLFDNSIFGKLVGRKVLKFFRKKKITKISYKQLFFNIN